MPIMVRDHRGGNWFWLHNAVIDEYGKALGAYGVAIYCVLCRHAGQEQTTWIGQRNIADEVGASRTQVNRTIAKLRELGLIHVEDRQDEHGRTTSTYVLLTPPCTSQVQGCAPQVQGSVSQVQPLSPTATAMINKTHGTRPMEQGLSKDPHARQEESRADNDSVIVSPSRVNRRDLRPGTYLEAVLTDYSRELHDEAHAAANITRAARLQRASGLAEREFVEVVHAARTMTRARGNIRKAAEGDPALRNRMPYFFAVLEDLLARAGEEGPAEDPEEGASATGRGWTPEDAERYTSGPYGRLVLG